MIGRCWLILALVCLLLLTIVQADELETVATEGGSAAQQLLEQGDEVFRQGDIGQAAEVYKLAAKAAQKEMIVGIQGEALAQVARCYLKMDQKDEGRHWLLMAEEIITDQMPRAWSRYLGVRGRFEWLDDDLETATATFREMYDYCRQYDLFERAVDAAHMVALTAPPEEQIVWGQKGIEAAEQGGFEGWLGPLWNNLGWTYDDLGRYQESLDALLKAREYHWKLGGEMNKLIADWSVGHAYRMTGHYDEAARWMRPVLAWSERLYAAEKSPDAAEWMGHSCRELGELALQREELQSALQYLRRARKSLQEAGMPQWDADGFEELSKDIEKLSRQVAEEAKK
jgi:tetratricopeptide (TPR) repeat protein